MSDTQSAEAQTQETVNVKLAIGMIDCIIRSIDATHLYVLELGQARTKLIEAKMWLREAKNNE